MDVFRYARYEPQVTQIELHPYLTQEPYLELAKTLGIAVTAYSSFGPQGWVELGMDKNATSLMQHEVVTQVASKYGKSTFVRIPFSLASRTNTHAKPLPRFCCDGQLSVALLSSPRVTATPG